MNRTIFAIHAVKFVFGSNSLSFPSAVSAASCTTSSAMAGSFTMPAAIVQSVRNAARNCTANAAADSGSGRVIRARGPVVPAAAISAAVGAAVDPVTKWFEGSLITGGPPAPEVKDFGDASCCGADPSPLAEDCDARLADDSRGVPLDDWADESGRETFGVPFDEPCEETGADARTHTCTGRCTLAARRSRIGTLTGGGAASRGDVSAPDGVARTSPTP